MTCKTSVTKTYKTKDPFYLWVSKNIRLLEKDCVQKFGGFQKPTVMVEKYAFNIYITVSLKMLAGESSDTRIRVPPHCLQTPRKELHHVSLNTHRRKKYRQSICPTPRKAYPKNRRESPRSTHYSHTKHMLPHNHDGLIILFKFLNILVIFNISNINNK